MNLQFLLPDCPGFGVYQLDTSSFHSMNNINSTADLHPGHLPAGLDDTPVFAAGGAGGRTGGMVQDSACFEPYLSSFLGRSPEDMPRYRRGKALLLPPPTAKLLTTFFPGSCQSL